MEAVSSLGNGSGSDNDTRSGACCIPGTLLSSSAFSAPPGREPTVIAPGHRKQRWEDLPKVTHLTSGLEPRLSEARGRRQTIKPSCMSLRVKQLFQVLAV